jgi:hypothetical protein
MQVTANWELPVYQVIGPLIRVHWDYTHTTGEDDFDQPYDVWIAQEAVVPLDADRETFVQIVNSQGGDGAALADGWFN